VISSQLTVDSRVKLAVYDLLGREVAVLANGRYPAGTYSFIFDGNGLASGVYFYRLIAGENAVTRKMVLQK
ncbi:MAG: T9SS type A sorting domain-containing protein, partial [Bacteroidota bacterium]